MEAVANSGEFQLAEPFAIHGRLADKALGASWPMAAREVVVQRCRSPTTRRRPAHRDRRPPALGISRGNRGSRRPRTRRRRGRAPAGSRSSQPLRSRRRKTRRRSASPASSCSSRSRSWCSASSPARPRKRPVFPRTESRGRPLALFAKANGQRRLGQGGRFRQGLERRRQDEAAAAFRSRNLQQRAGQLRRALLHPRGQRISEQALGHYDAIAGFDHKTLAKSVGDNAKDLFAALETLPDGEVEIDAIAFSRGGLVLRYLTEVLLPPKKSRFHLRKAIFVGCTNGGTKLADPKNWKDLVDLYTNLVSAASRLANTPSADRKTKAISKIVAGALRGVFRSSATWRTETTTGGAVPGLASMSPDGADVDADQQPPGRPARARQGRLLRDRRRTSITMLFGDREAEKLRVAEAVLLGIRRQFHRSSSTKAQNDLVVDRASMSRIDPWTHREVDHGPPRLRGRLRRLPYGLFLRSGAGHEARRLARVGRGRPDGRARARGHGGAGGRPAGPPPPDRRRGRGGARQRARRQRLHRRIPDLLLNGVPLDADALVDAYAAEPTLADPVLYGKYLFRLVTPGAIGAAWKKLRAASPAGLTTLLELPEAWRKLPWELLFAENMFAFHHQRHALGLRLPEGAITLAALRWPLRMLVLVGSDPNDPIADAAEKRCWRSAGRSAPFPCASTSRCYARRFARSSTPARRSAGGGRTSPPFHRPRHHRQRRYPQPDR